MMEWHSYRPFAVGQEAKVMKNKVVLSVMYIIILFRYEI